MVYLYNLALTVMCCHVLHGDDVGLGYLFIYLWLYVFAVYTLCWTIKSATFIFIIDNFHKCGPLLLFLARIHTEINRGKCCMKFYHLK